MSFVRTSDSRAQGRGRPVSDARRQTLSGHASWKMVGPDSLDPNPRRSPEYREPQKTTGLPMVHVVRFDGGLALLPQLLNRTPIVAYKISTLLPSYRNLLTRGNAPLYQSSRRSLALRASRPCARLASSLYLLLQRNGECLIRLRRQNRSESSGNLSLARRNILVSLIEASTSVRPTMM